MAVALELAGVSHRYGRHWALRDVDLRIGVGLVGLLGPNGAGKSTLLSIAATLIGPRSGRVSVMGRDVKDPSGRRAARSYIGMLPQRFALVPSMRVLDTVAYAAWVNGVTSVECTTKAEAALAAVGLHDLLDVRVRKLSGGQRQRVGIASAIAHEPALLLLDEATVGIDPVARVQLRRYLLEIAQGRSVIVSTHLVEDVVQLCERIVVLNRGRLVYDGGTESLVETIAPTERSPLASPLEAAYERLLGSDSMA